MSEITDLLARYDQWCEEREALSAMEESEDGPPSSSQWEASDDAGNEMGGEAIELLRRPIKVWTCAVVHDDRPDLHPFTVTVHRTEVECFEHLRDQYDPESYADDEPPVAIVGHMEDNGFRVDVDVHEVTR